MVGVANGKSWGIFWGLVEENSFWNEFFNIKLRSFIKCPPLDAIKDKKKIFNLVSFSESAQNREVENSQQQ